MGTKYGEYTTAQMTAGIPIADIPGDDCGVAPLVAVITCGDLADPPLPASDPTILMQVFPGGASTVGTDSLGQIGVIETLTRDGLDPNSYDGLPFTSGFAGQGAKIVLIPLPDVLCYINIDFLDDPLSNYPAGGVPGAATGADIDSATYDEDEDRQTLTITFTPPGNEDANVVTMVADGTPTTILTLPPGTTTTTVTLPPVAPGVIVTILITPVIISPPTSGTPASTPPFTVPFNAMAPLVMSGGIDLGGTMVVQALTDPSGVYTLVPGKRSDTLYDRIPTEITVEVKIPDPYVKTAFVGE
jgi:hypothetical protein